MEVIAFGAVKPWRDWSMAIVEQQSNRAIWVGKRSMFQPVMKAVARHNNMMENRMSTYAAFFPWFAAQTPQQMLSSYGRHLTPDTLKWWAEAIDKELAGEYSDFAKRLKQSTGNCIIMAVEFGQISDDHYSPFLD